MNILFLDQSGKLGGAELSLLDVASAHREKCCVALFESGPFKTALERREIPVQVLISQALEARKQNNIWQNVSSLWQLIPMVKQVAQLSYSFDLIYANTAKALVVGALASLVNRRPLVYHLRDIISQDHFSRANQGLLVNLANQQASLVIANSHATKDAFVEAGGNADLVKVIYNGVDPNHYQASADTPQQLREELGLTHQFVVSHFSRLAPWKGQHILIDALAQCPESVTALLVGDALFGEQDYVDRLHQQVKSLGLEHRVKFLGFRHDIPQLMTACDLVVHTSTAPEPFGRVIIEAMFCGTSVVAAAAGGATELVEHGQTGWLSTPGNSQKLADIIMTCCDQPEHAMNIAAKAQTEAYERFNVTTMNRQITQLLRETVKI